MVDDGVVNRCFLCLRPRTNRECAHPSLGLDDTQDPDHVDNEDVEDGHHVKLTQQTNKPNDQTNNAVEISRKCDNVYMGRKALCKCIHAYNRLTTHLYVQCKTLRMMMIQGDFFNPLPPVVDVAK